MRDTYISIREAGKCGILTYSREVNDSNPFGVATAETNSIACQTVDMRDHMRIYASDLSVPRCPRSVLANRERGQEILTDWET